MLHLRDVNRVNEQSYHDRRRREQDVVDESGGAGEPTVLAEFSQINTGQDSDRGADKCCDPDYDDAPEDGVEQASCGAWRGGHLGK